MSLSIRLRETAKRMIENYGNTIELIDNSNEGVYDPQIGKRIITSVTYVKKGFIKNITEEELKIAGIPENLFGKITMIVTVAYDDDLTNVNNKWTINGFPIYKSIKTTIMDETVVLKFYAG